MICDSYGIEFVQDSKIYLPILVCHDTFSQLGIQPKHITKTYTILKWYSIGRHLVQSQPPRITLANVVDGYHRLGALILQFRDMLRIKGWNVNDGIGH